MITLLRWLSRTALVAIALFTCVALDAPCVAADRPSPDLELTRAVRPWEFLSAVGTRAALFGNESGTLEAWVYPLKLFRNFQLRFRVDGHVLPASSLARTVIVRPESTSIVYAWDTFSVRETLFVPVQEQGAIIRLDIDTSQPLEITAAFERDFQLEWPASLADSDIDWIPASHAFLLTANQQKFAALVGSPSATDHHQEYSTNYAASAENSIDLGVTAKGHDTRFLVLAASFAGRAPAEALYHRLSTSYDDLLKDAATYYTNYLENTVRLDLPDKTLEQAYDWARVTVLQGLVDNPFLGTSLIAGYGLSGTDQRPGYAWFFGRDALWTSFALNAAGDFRTTRTALDFLSKYQRADGKVPHEIAQGASFVPWFQDLPYAYAAADATPLYILAINNYVRRSGDADFATQHWDNIWRAYQFLQSTYNADGFPRNINVGHGWVEGGPLLPVESEFYQSALAVETLHALANLAELCGKPDLVAGLDQSFHDRRDKLNRAFWLPAKHRYAFALDGKDQPVDTPSVLATVPMWFDLLDPEKANDMIAQLAAPDHQTDWGMRILSSGDPRYDPSGYHFGTVWPLFTGWASVGEYRYHRVFAAYSNLRANALLTFDGSLGHVTEVLSGSYYQGLATASPQQIWSSAMVINPLLLGMLGLDPDAGTHRIAFAPHVPANWTSFSIANVQAGSACSARIEFHRAADTITLEAQNSAAANTQPAIPAPKCEVEFSPAISLRADVLAAQLNGKPISFHVESNANDQHVTVRIPVSNTPATLAIHLRDDFGFSESSALPSLGGASQGMRLISQTWSADRNTLSLEIMGSPGHRYDLALLNAAQIASIDGARLQTGDDGRQQLAIAMPDDASEPTAHSHVVLHFVQRSRHN